MTTSELESSPATAGEVSRTPGDSRRRKSTLPREQRSRPAGDSPADRSVTVTVEDLEGTRTEFRITDDDGGVILTYNDTPYILATSDGIGWWPDRTKRGSGCTPAAHPSAASSASKA